MDAQRASTVDVPFRRTFTAPHWPEQSHPRRGSAGPGRDLREEVTKLQYSLNPSADRNSGFKGRCSAFFASRKGYPPASKDADGGMLGRWPLFLRDPTRPGEDTKVEAFKAGNHREQFEAGSRKPGIEPRSPLLLIARPRLAT